MQISKLTSKTYDLTATNAVWIAMASLHTRFPKREAFTQQEIENEVASLHLFVKDPKTISKHIEQHLVATKRANAKPRRMLTELSKHHFRLFAEGDQYHSDRVNSPVHPPEDKLPLEFRPLLVWYQDWSKRLRSKKQTAAKNDPLLALMGTWTFGDANIYLREMRDGWNERP